MKDCEDYSAKGFKALLVLHAMDAELPMEAITTYFKLTVDEVYLMADQARDDIQQTIRNIRALER